MKLRFSEQPQLPPRAWAAVVRKGNETVHVLHGRAPDIRADALIEAAWDGPFDHFDPVVASIFCGTGVVADRAGVHFSASSDRLSPIFSVQKDDVLYVSNSPVFAITLAGEVPDDNYPFYLYQFNRIFRLGLREPSGKVRLKSGRKLCVHFYVIMTVDPDGNIRFRPHAPGEAPGDYRSYRSLLLNGMRRVLENAADPRRKSPCRPLAAISRGYDSTATAALAAEAGCKESFSFVDPDKRDPRIDSGKSNAETLGMTCVEYSRRTYLKSSDAPEAEFSLWGTSMLTPLLSLERELGNRILITGHLGDLVWIPPLIKVYDQLTDNWARTMTGFGQIEYRLRVGYLVFAPCTIGARHARAIERIVHSDDMKPWSIGGDYDRPVPRRLAEDAGLPRESFGMTKRAGGHTHFGHGHEISASSLTDYQRFLDARPRNPALLYWRIRTMLRYLVWDLFCSERKLYQRWYPWRRYVPFLFNTVPIRLPWKFLFSFQWSFHRLKNRYKVRVPQTET